MGWKTPLLGLDTLEVTEDQLKEIREDADFDGPLIEHSEKGNTIELIQQNWKRQKYWREKLQDHSEAVDRATKSVAR